MLCKERHDPGVHLGQHLAVKAGRVAMFGDCAHTRGPETRVLDAQGAYLVPGLIDTHMHVESAMATVSRFAEAVLPHGTTTVLIDNHEMANVLGLDGIRWMLEEGSRLQLKVLLAVPSCVPALPGFSIGEGRLAWATPRGQGGEGSRIQVAAWSETDVGIVESSPGEDPVVIR